MDTERYRQVRSLAEAALDMTTEARPDWLRQACGSDDALLAEAQRWLAAVDAAESEAFLDAPSLPTSDRVEGGERRYRLLRELGRGGMGTVWLAERSDGEFSQQVALKTLNLDAANPTMLAERLRAERQILAQLVHPNIARLLDGGTDAQGRPFLVMEYVEGERIDRWCETHVPNVEARIALFLRICDAVQYAHQQLVVHRDIKPGNILVDATGAPKLLDFGIARLMQEGDGTPTVTTDRLLTFHYASPEQIRGDPVGTSSDVYSLAVVLYRLLTGTMPYAAPDATAPELARAVLDDAPRTPSRSVEDLAVSRRGILTRDIDSALLAQRLSGDLDAILLRALRKEPGERYATVAQFADDLRRHLDGQPVLARQGQRGYALRKFAGRHRLAVSLAAIAFATLVGFIVALQQQLARVEVERDRASAVTAFITGMFESGNPMASTPGASGARAQLTVRAVLDREAPRIERELQTQPEVQATLLGTIGRVYEGLDQREQAERYLGAALERLDALDPAPSRAKLDLLLFLCQARGVHGGDSTLEVCEQAHAMAQQLTRGDDFDMARAIRGRSDGLRLAGRYDEAEAAKRAALAMFERLDRPEWVAGLHSDLAEMAFLRGDALECLRQIEPVLAHLTATYGAEHARRGDALSQRAHCKLALGQPGDAEPDLREALALTEQAFGRDSETATRARRLNDLGLVLNQQGRYAEAEPLLRDAHRIDVAVYGPSHPEFGTVLVNLSASLDGLGRVDEGLDLLRQALAISARRHGDERRMHALGLHNLGFRLLREKRVAEAEPALRESLAIYDGFERDHPDRASTLANLGALLTETNRAAEALPLLREALAIREAQLASGVWPIDVSRSLLGACLGRLGERGEAEALLRAGHEGLLHSQGADHRRTREAQRRLREFLDVQ